MQKDRETLEKQAAVLQGLILATQLRETDLKNSIPNTFLKLLADMRELKGNDRSPAARHCAIVITDLEGAYARFTQFVLKE